MSSPVGLLYNPKSHRVSSKGSVLQAASEALAHEQTVRLENFDTLARHMAWFAECGVKTILIEGGDGTAQAVITECLSGRAGFAETPSFALIPGGITNLAPKTIGLKQWGVKNIIWHVRQLEAGEVHKSTVHHLLKVQPTNGGASRLGFMLSTGAAPRAMIYCRAHLHSHGAAGSLAVGLTLLRLLFHRDIKDEQGMPLLRPTPLSFSTPQMEKSGNHLFAMATTLPQLLFGLNPFWGKGDGALRFIHAEWPIKRFTRTALSMLLGNSGPHLEKRGLNSVKSNMIKLTHDGDFVLDGEFLPQQPDNTYIVGLTPELRFLR
nr:MAG: hypothetical protein E4H34_00305 [Hyphomicrobiales bacterium]